MAHAQDTNPERTITNTAEASWTFAGIDFDTESNEVVIAVDPSPPKITAFRPSPGSATQFVFQNPVCGTGQSVQNTNGGQSPQMTTSSVEQTNILNAGENLLFEVNAAAANLDPNSVNSLIAVIETSSGDREEITIFESEPNSGIFIGEIPTVRMPPAPVQSDCQLSLADGNMIEISIRRDGQADVIVSTDVEVLADPFGVVFDSETGEPVSGATVTLIDVATGLPATVFAEDGVTPWPSTVISGQPITDGAGNVIPMAPGEYWFPLTFLGQYRIDVTPPAPYTDPSVVTPDQIAQIARPDGRAFVIDPSASYGGSFELSDPTPIQIDIPLDRPATEIALSKTASRGSAQPGDVVFYTITARNPDSDRVKRDVTLVDVPSNWMRLRQDTVRIDGAADPSAVTTTADGRQITFELGDIAAGASRRVVYAMTVRPDAPPGDAVNEATATDSLGRSSTTNAVVDIERESIAGRMTIIGRITSGPCTIDDPRVGIPGVRVMMEDGSFAITDADGRYHFEGVVPGTHVVQASRMTLPEGGEFLDCHQSSRNAGSATSRFIIGQGGSLKVADFHAILPQAAHAELATRKFADAVDEPIGSEDTAAERPAGSVAKLSAIDTSGSAPERPAQPVIAPTQDWLALGDGEDGFLAPTLDANPRAPSIRVAIRHRKGQKVDLRINGEPVDPLAFDGTSNPKKGRYAVSEWRGVPLLKERTVLTADIINTFGTVRKTFKREVFFTTTPAKVEFVPEQSKLIADGRTRPVLAIRVLDRNNRPLREGISGEFELGAPYQSADQLDRQQLNQLTGLGASSARWVIKGNEGIAHIELAPTMVSGSLRLDFRFDDGEVVREQELETWIEPGDIEWTVIGLIEGTVGARSVADNMERSGRFDSDLGDDARVALYAKGRVLGKYLLTLAYDSAKQREDQRVLGTLDPNAYYTVFADGSSRRFDAASREKLYVRIETSTFYALYGDFETGFDQTRLTRYNRTATGVKGEARLGAVRAEGFAAEVSSRFQRDEFQGQGITGPYALSDRSIIANSETITLETRDRFRSELIVSSRELTRFIDYDIDLLSGTITFKQPVLSRDFDLNPQFIVAEYETDGLGNSELNAGLRTSWTDKSGKIRIGATAVTDKGDDARTNMGGLDLRAEIGENTEVRAEVALSRKEGETATGWMVEAQHRTSKFDVLAYARQLDANYGIGQQSGAELGRRKFGVDGRMLINEELSVVGSVWQDDSLTDTNRRRAGQVDLAYRSQNTDGRIGIAHFNDRLADGTRNKSTVLEIGATQRLANNKLELSATSSIALNNTESVDLPNRHRLSARYAVTNNVKLVGQYERADGENIEASSISGGVEVTPWNGAQVVSTVGKQRIDEAGTRSYAAFGLSQTLQVSPTLTLDATIDGSRTLNGTGNVADVVNPAQPVATGGQLSNGTLFEDFTAVTLGAAWRKDRWSAIARGEYRDGEFANRKGVTAGAIRQLGEGSIVGSGFTWTNAKANNGAASEIFDASIAFAHRPDNSDFAVLSKLEYRSDSITNAVAGDAGPAGQTALLVDGSATSRRVLASVSANWSPRGWDEDKYEVEQQVRRDEFELFVGTRYNFDRFENIEFEGTSLLVGADARIGITDRFELGATGTVRANLEDNVTSFSYGPQVGFVPADGMLLTLGYNVEGFRDRDFGEARSTDKGVYAAVRIKFDADTFSFLGLGR
ncbi:MAG: hypothetical protein ABJ242_11595 [Marinomonas sp.]